MFQTKWVKHMKANRVFLVFLLAVQFGLIIPTAVPAGDLQDAEMLNDRVTALYQEGRYGENIPLALQALAALEKVYGPNPPEAVTVLKYLAKSYSKMGDPAQAAPYYARELLVFEQAYGPEHIDVAFKRNQLAKLYLEIGQYDRAVPLLKTAIEIREKKLGPDHKNLADLLNRLANAYQGLGEYAEAETLYTRALAIREKSLGPEHVDVAVSLNNLGAVHFFQGEYDLALPLYRRSLDILEKTLGPGHTQVASTHVNLAELYRAKGDYAQAEKHFLWAIDIWKKSGQTETRDYAAALNNLAEYYRTLGAMPSAEKLYKEALGVMERLYTSNHPDWAATLNNIALMYQDMGRCEETIPLFTRVLATWENTLGPEHPLVALCLNNLATSYLCLGLYSEAAEELERALPLLQKTLGSNHPQVGTAFNNAAVIYESQGEFSRADEYYQTALSVFETDYGPDHPDVSLCLHNMARLDMGTGRIKSGVERYTRAQEIDRKLIDQVMGFASEDRQLRFLTAKRDELHVFLSQVVQAAPNDPQARLAALNAWLKRKGLILEAQRRFQEALAYSDNPEAIRVFQKLGRIRAELSRLLLSGPGSEAPEAYRERVDALEKERAALEAGLIELSQTFAQAQKKSRADARQAAAALPSGSVLLEFARIDMFDFKASRRRPAHYLAFVLPAGKGDRAGLVDLGPADPIDEATARLRDLVTDLEQADQLTAEARALYDQVFAPILKELGPSREVFISPDGNLNLIPFEILQGPDGHCLIEDFTFNYLNSGRDLLGFGHPRSDAGRPLLLGDPDFDAAGQPAGPAKNRCRRSRELRDLEFGRLPGTLDEVQAIASILGPDQCALVTGSEARESALTAVDSPQILHLATHGFFLTDQDLDIFRNQGQVGQGLVGLPGPDGPSGFENLLLRSGLALAGANRTIQTSGTQASDGLLTAEKVLGLRLGGTELVVLSACETGVGEVKSGEGVYGLRRAFIQAGAKGLIMSLWPIPDQETKELMTAFYRNFAQGDMPRAQALRQAALNQMRITAERYGRPHPLFWGAFVYLGEP